MSALKIKNDIKELLKMGLSQEMAELVAYANNKKPEVVQDTVSLLSEEQEEIKKMLEIGGFQPLTDVKPIEGIVVGKTIEAPVTMQIEDRAGI
jgi:hypothetical protein